VLVCQGKCVVYIRDKEGNTEEMLRGTKGTVAVTVRLDEERYRRLVGYGARFTPRKTNQEILVEALDRYLEKVGE
jgi:hypothetical protein